VNGVPISRPIGFCRAVGEHRADAGVDQAVHRAFGHLK
jgi:hypothetical protein